MNQRVPILERSGIPLYIQVAGLLRRRLEAAEWQLGERIPTIDALMTEYGVSRVTMREALAQLESQGLVRRGQGRGTFVTRDASKERWLIVPSEWEALVKHIDELQATVEEVSHDKEAPRLEPSYGKVAGAYWHARRINRADGTPYSLADVYLSREYFDRDPRSYATKPVLPLLARAARRSIRQARQILAVGTAGFDVSRYLDLVIGAPIAEVRRLVVDHRGQVIYLADVSYPSRYLRIETTLYSHGKGNK